MLMSAGTDQMQLVVLIALGVEGNYVTLRGLGLSCLHFVLLVLFAFDVCIVARNSQE